MLPCMKTWEITAIGVTGFVFQALLYSVLTGVLGILLGLD